MITCPSCNHQNEEGSSFCENCGHDLRELAQSPPPPPMPEVGGGTPCPSCNFSNIPGATFCENCGTQLGQVTPPAVPDPIPVPTPPVQESSADETACPSCGHQNVPGSVFCENCGSQLGKATPEVPPEAPIAVPPDEAPPAPSVESPAPQPSDVENPCPQCGFSNPDGTVFCGSCGMQLVEAPVTPEIEPAKEAAPSAAPEIEPVEKAAPPAAPPSDQIIGRLAVKKTGNDIVIPPGLTEAIVGREDPVSGIFPEIDLDPHGGHDGGVGRRHARLFIQGAQLMIEDLDSVNGTLVNKQKLPAREPHQVADGDELRFGKVVVTYHAS